MAEYNIADLVDRLKANSNAAVELVAAIAEVPIPIIEMARKMAAEAFVNIDSTAPTAAAPAVPAPRKRGRPKKTEAAA